MPTHLMELPRRVAVGMEIIKQVGGILEDLETGSRSLILSGPNVQKLIRDRLSLSLHDNGFSSQWVQVGNSNFQEVERITNIA